MLQLYVIKDNKSGGFQAPQFFKNVADCLRTLQLHMEEGKSMLAKFPSDFSLYFVGSFDETSGFLYPTAEAGPQHTLELVELMKGKVNNEQA